MISRVIPRFVSLLFLLSYYPLFGMERMRSVPKLSMQVLSYLTAKTKSDQRNSVSLEPHTCSVTALCMDTKGHLFSGSSDSTIKIWHIASLADAEAKATALRGVLARSPLYIGLLPKELLLEVTKLMIAVDNFQCLTTLAGHTSDVKALCIDKDELLCSGSANSLRFWQKTDVNDPRTYTCVAAEITRDAVLCMCINKTKDLLFTGQKNGIIELWHKRKSLGTLNAHFNDVTALAINSQGDLFSVSIDGHFIRWTMNEPTKARGYYQTQLAHAAHCIPKSLYNDKDMRLLVGLADGSISIWQHRPYQVGYSTTNTATFKVHDAELTFITMDANGRLYVGCRDGSIKVLQQTEAKGQVDFFYIGSLDGHKRDIGALVMDSAGRLFSGSWDKLIKMWCMDEPDNAQTYQCKATCEEKDLK